MDFENAYKKMDNITRSKYIKVYHKLGENMFSECQIPNVADFANAYGKKNGKSKEALEKIQTITSFTGNSKDIEASCKRVDATYTEAESNKFIWSVIAANVTDITESGYFYKKLISSCDNMRIDLYTEDCGSNGEEVTLPIDENTYNYKIKNHFITELDCITENYNIFKRKTASMSSIHVRNFLTCNTSKDHRCFCKRCAGLYKREHNSEFIPKYIGVYATLMITEHATQASLDSMNKGTADKLNVLIEQQFDNKKFTDYESVVEVIHQIIDQIGNVGVESRFYEIALLSRFYKQSDGSYMVAPLVTSFLRQGDALGSFIYKPNETNFIKLLSTEKLKADSLKSQIMFDIYE